MKIDSVITLREPEMKRGQWEKLLTMLTFYDGDGIEIQAYDHRPGAGVVVVPRGVLPNLPSRLEIIDLRCRPKAPKLSYAKQLGGEGYEGQIEALAAMVVNEQGQIIAPPGRGKTEIALAFAAQCKTPTLVIVHTKDLYDQWRERTKEAVPGASLGEIKAGICHQGHITIAMAQTLKRFVNAGRKFWQQWGCLIVDEQHHAAAETWEWILNACPAYYRFGFTASERRADGRHPLVRFYIGPVIYRMKFVSQVPLTIQPIYTSFGKLKTVYRGPFDWQRMLRLLSTNKERNGLIADHVLADIAGGHTVLVLSRQIRHLEGILKAMQAREKASEDFTLLTGKLSGTHRLAAVQGLRDGRLRCILATQLADEGLDVPRLDRLHLTFPGKHDGRIIQQIGRTIRIHDDKDDAIVYDYVDPKVAVLLRQYDERHSTYRQLGIEIRKAVDYANPQKSKGRAVRDLISLARRGSPARPGRTAERP